MSGLEGYSRGLRVISNNTANINTPGFKSSTLQFSDLFYTPENSSGAGDGSSTQLGNGLNTGNTVFNFIQGDFSQTGNDLDMAVDGQGFFILQDAKGNIHYTRDGQFKFDDSGILINSADSDKVMGFDANGQLTPITINGLKVSPGQATTTVKFTGNLSSAQTTQTVGNITVIDAVGGTHTLSATFTAGTTSGNWTVTVKDGTTTVGTGNLNFISGTPDPTASTISLSYTPAGLAAQPLTLDFSSNVTSFSSGSLSSLAMDTQDGLSPGGVTKTAFDTTGTLVLTYSNGKTVNGSQLALANFDSPDQAVSSGGNQFEASSTQAWHVGVAGNGSFGNIRSGVIEMSNVDLSQEFSNLVITQRGYQASSQIVSTANDMLQELFSMKK
jgi:flagellar hook protein FlgE